MIAQPPAKAICFPPAPLNGGTLETAPAKIGEWVWQPKVDDWRAVIHTPSGTVWNQYGQLSSIRNKFGPALDRLATVSFAAEWLDVGMMEQRNNLMRGCIIVLDIIAPDMIQAARYIQLVSTFTPLPYLTADWLKRRGGQVRDEVFAISQWGDRQQTPLEGYRHLQAQNTAIGHKFYEGVVAKRSSAPYLFGNRPKQQDANLIKHRFDQ